MSAAKEIHNELVLAAIDRAERHRTRDTPGVPRWAITGHLDIPRLTPHVRAQLEALEAAGSLERSRRHSIDLWVLTSAGRRRFQRARRAGNVPELPESPQHRAWANARTLSGQEIGRFHLSLRDAVEEAAGLLDVPVPTGPPSDAWFVLGERLHGACRRLASATYCLHEWPEPNDAHPDIDTHREPTDKALTPAERARRFTLRHSRRNVSLWGIYAREAGEED